MKWLPLLLCTAACADEMNDPHSATVTLEERTWSAAAYSIDVNSPQTVSIALVRHLDRDECASNVLDMVEITMLVGDRGELHNLATLDLTTPFSGYVTYTDREQNYHRAVAGFVWPGRTTWEYSEREGHNVIVGIDGELDVTLPDGRALSGAFSATPCTYLR